MIVDEPGFNGSHVAFQIEDEDDVDLSQLPTNGMEYVKRVRLEARDCLEVSVSKKDFTKFLPKQTPNYNSYEKTLSSHMLIPSDSWQQEQVEEFMTLKEKLKDLKIQGKNSVSFLFSFPENESKNSWDMRCSKYLSILDQKNEPPLLSTVLSMPQPFIEILLEHHVEKLSVNGMSYQQGLWFYALLSCLETPLSPHICHLLRTLSRSCASLRSSLPSSEDQLLVPLNLIICLVGHCFGQKDLIDGQEKEELLKTE